jgi:hypothetical protein
MRERRRGVLFWLLYQLQQLEKFENSNLFAFNQALYGSNWQFALFTFDSFICSKNMVTIKCY